MRIETYKYYLSSFPLLHGNIRMINDRIRNFRNTWKKYCIFMYVIKKNPTIYIISSIIMK